MEENLLLMRHDHRGIGQVVSVEGGRISFGMKAEQYIVLERKQGSVAEFKFLELQVRSAKVEKFTPDSLGFLC